VKVVSNAIAVVTLAVVGFVIVTGMALELGVAAAKRLT
jgi:hypothetical protein